MKIIKKQQSTVTNIVTPKQRSYSDIIKFLDHSWSINTQDTELTVIKRLDAALGKPSQSVPTVLITGTNGKSTTIHFTSKLLKTEGLKVGAFYAPHLLNYNERIAINEDLIPNKLFTEIANEVLDVAEHLSIQANSYELLTTIAFIYFKKQNVDVALMEIGNSAPYKAPSISSPRIIAVTRITNDDDNIASEGIQKLILETLSIVQKGTHVISADQSKMNLQTMHSIVKDKEGIWEMPIRKVVALSYPLEQLYGRCAALAERLSFIFVNTFLINNETIVKDTLLTKREGKRGRPTIAAKKEHELNPQKTLAQFWKETSNTLPARFHLLDKEKPSILLDTAQNLDALDNIFLGVRLIHYHRKFQGIALVLGFNNPEIDQDKLFKSLRYFCKKTLSITSTAKTSIFLCPVKDSTLRINTPSWDVNKITTEIKNFMRNLKIKIHGCSSLQEGLTEAQKVVDDRDGLVMVVGSPEIVSEFWQLKGIKKI
ncbi:MAG: hypothetical protein WBQ73_02100 [Candidatus Babeliales bacterium]